MAIYKVSFKSRHRHITTAAQLKALVAAGFNISTKPGSNAAGTILITSGNEYSAVSKADWFMNAAIKIKTHTGGKPLGDCLTWDATLEP